MSISPDRCQQLHKLHAQLTTQIQLLKENIQKEEREGGDTSLEALNTLKSLQSSLKRISLELEQCPPAKEEAASTPTSAPASWLNRSWYPDSVDTDDSEPELLLDDN